MKLPAAQTAHAVHAAAPPAEKPTPGAHAVHALLPAAAAEPGPHREHTASRVVVHAELGTEPAPHTVQGEHE